MSNKTSVLACINHKEQKKSFMLQVYIKKKQCHMNKKYH